MKSIMIIAGDKTEKLADFFTERGAFSVDYAYNSLSTNVVQISYCMCIRMVSTLRLICRC